MIQIHNDFLRFKRPSDHSLFSPSSADRWLETGCSFSVNFAKDIPNLSSKYSLEGTLAHSVCEAVFRQAYYGLDIPYDLQMQMLNYDGIEMMDCAHAYVEVLTYWLRNKEQIGEIVHFDLEMGIPVFPEESCFGTGDCIIIGTKGAAVIDYKHGKGKSVSADSLQLKVYAAGVAKYLRDIPEDYLVHAVVFQPRTDMAPKETSYNIPELNQFLGVIWSSIQKSKQVDLAPCEGSHCFWCPAKRTYDLKLKCPIFLEKPMKLAAENFSQFMVDMSAPIDHIGAPNRKRDEAIIKLRTLYPLIKEVVENSESEFLMRLQDGEVIEGVRMIEALGNRELNGENDAQKAALIVSVAPEIEVFKSIPASKKLRTISDIEKEIGKNKLDSICVRKRTLKVDVLDEKMRSVLGEMAAFGEMINNGKGQE
jgi:hypothetical protein